MEKSGLHALVIVCYCSWGDNNTETFLVPVNDDEAGMLRDVNRMVPIRVPEDKRFSWHYVMHCLGIHYTTPKGFEDEMESLDCFSEEQLRVLRNTEISKWRKYKIEDCDCKKAEMFSFIDLVYE